MTHGHAWICMPPACFCAAPGLATSLLTLSAPDLGDIKVDTNGSMVRQHAGRWVWLANAQEHRGAQALARETGKINMGNSFPQVEGKQSSAEPIHVLAGTIASLARKRLRRSPGASVRTPEMGPTTDPSSDSLALKSPKRRGMAPLGLSLTRPH